MVKSRHTKRFGVGQRLHSRPDLKNLSLSFKSTGSSLCQLRKKKQGQTCYISYRFRPGLYLFKKQEIVQTWDMNLRCAYLGLFTSTDLGSSDQGSCWVAPLPWLWLSPGSGNLISFPCPIWPGR